VARIRVTGYLDTDDLDPDHVDLGHETGLSGRGDEAITSVFGDAQVRISELEDLKLELIYGED
jgi:hypothetical protein